MALRSKNKGKQYYDKWYLCKQIHELVPEKGIQGAFREEKKVMAILIRFLRGQYDIDTTLGDWTDLRCMKDMELKAGESTILPLGVAMKLPTGFEAHLLARSSTFKNWGIIQTNGMGVIDNAYSGNHDEWGMPVYATRDTFIAKGSRVCQFRLTQKQNYFTLQPTDWLPDNDRGGFGSTGRN